MGESLYSPELGAYGDTPEKVEVLIATVSKDWFTYRQIEEKQPDGLDHLVYPPQMAFSNIKNGYGMIYGNNESIIQIK